MNTVNEPTVFQNVLVKIEKKYEEKIKKCPFSIMAIDCTDLRSATEDSKVFYGRQITNKDIKTGKQSLRANYYVLLDPKKIIKKTSEDIYSCSTVDELYQVLECLLTHPELFIDYENSNDVLSQPDTMSLSDLTDACYPGMKKLGIDKVIT